MVGHRRGEALRLAQRATLETRDAKHGPHALAEQRTGMQAAETLQQFGTVQAMIGKTLNRSRSRAGSECGVGDGEGGEGAGGDRATALDLAELACPR